MVVMSVMAMAVVVMVAVMMVIAVMVGVCVGHPSPPASRQAPLRSSQAQSKRPRCFEPHSSTMQEGPSLDS